MGNVEVKLDGNRTASRPTTSTQPLPPERYRPGRPRRPAPRLRHVTAKIDSNWTFSEVRGGRNIELFHNETGTTIPFTLNIDTDATLFGVGADNVGQADITTNGAIVATERPVTCAWADPVHGSDVTLTAPAAILDADGVYGADVLGTDITMTAGTGGSGGGVGTAANFLGDRLDRRHHDHRHGLREHGGRVRHGDAGDLKVKTVDTKGNASLATAAGSILDGRADGNADVLANTINLRGAGRLDRHVSEDLEIDSQKYVTGGTFGAQGQNGIWSPRPAGTCASSRPAAPPATSA